MKKLMFFCLITTSVIVMSCSKTGNEETMEATGTNEKEITAGRPFEEAAGVGANLNRGAKHKRRRDGLSCGCYRCFGICFAVADDEGSDAMTVVMQPTGDTKATLYILRQPDEEVNEDPVMHVDENVAIVNSRHNTVILAGEYPYNSTSGYINYNGKEHFYYGTVTVNYQ